MRHVFLNWPTRGSYDSKMASIDRPDLIWKYPPTYPTELYWGGALNALRVILHPEIVSKREMSAYLLELGECSLLSSRSMISASSASPLQGPLPLREFAVRDLDISTTPPGVAGGETPLEQAIYRLVVIELTNGFPYAIDPGYAHRTLALGREAEWAIIAASHSPHLFLSRNAVAVLGVLPYPAARARLREIVNEDGDPIQWTRAAMALVRARDLESVKVFENFAVEGNILQRSVALFALGKLADPRALPTVLKIARETDDSEVLWGALPALVRLADDRPEVHDTLKELGKKRIGAASKAKGIGNFQPPKPEPAGTQTRIFGEMILLARAVAGDEAKRKDFLYKANVRGLTSFMPANYYLVIDALRRLGRQGQPALEKILADRKVDSTLKTYALNALRPLADDVVPGLMKITADRKVPSVLRTTALLALTERKDPGAARDAALGIAQAYAKSGKATTPPEAAVVAGAVQVLSTTEGGLPVDLGIRIVERALRDRVWGFRVTRDSKNLNKALVYSQPPLLEIAVVELGRAGDPKAIPILSRVLRSRAGAGRGEAALALGALGGAEGTEALLLAIRDPISGWVRFNAYRSLRTLSGRDYPDDWLHSTPTQLRESIISYMNWWKSVKE